MDLVSGVRRVIVVMEHTAPDGGAKLLRECTLPLTGTRVVQRVITDLCVLDITPDGIRGESRWRDGVTREQVRAEDRAPRVRSRTDGTAASIIFVQTGFRFSRNAAIPSRKSRFRATRALASIACAIAASATSLFCAANNRLVAASDSRAVCGKRFASVVTRSASSSELHNLIHQPKAVSLFRIEDAARQQQIAATLVANLQSQKCGHQRGYKADARFGESELCRRSSQREVADRWPIPFRLQSPARALRRWSAWAIRKA